jgi:hypothetical protein
MQFMVSIVVIYLLYITKDTAKKIIITMVEPFARASGMIIPIANTLAVASL